MNKLFKGAIAGAAGVALLLGGAGTLASWNSSADVAGGKIVAGNLAVADTGTAGTWTANGTAINISTFKAVPGDTLVYTKTMAITAQGDNLVANLALAPASISAVSTGAADVALASYLNKTAALSATGTGISGSGTSYTITAGANGVAQNVTASVTISFPKNGAAGFENNTKLGQVTLDKMALTLTQS